MTVSPDLNTALFSSSFRLTESKIGSFNEIVSGISRSDKKCCCLKVVYRGLDDFGTIPSSAHIPATITSVYGHTISTSMVSRH
jgi:hypothetical protein